MTMNVLMLSTDAKILDAKSAVAHRMREYGTIFQRLTILVLGVGERQALDLKPNVHVLFPGGASRRDAFKNALWEGMREGRNLPASIVSVQDPFFVGFVGWRIAKALRVPLQAQAHTDFLNPAYFFASLRKSIEVVLSLFVVSQASCVRVVSKRIARSMAFLHKRHVAILPIRVTPLSEKRECPHDFLEGPRILMVSRLESEKRIERAIQALPSIKDAHLYIVGDGSLRLSLEKTVRDLHAESRVHFLGWKKDVSQYYWHADIFLHLSRFEGYGIALVEAGLAGLPIITTDVGVVGDVFIKDSSALVISGSRQSIVSSLSHVLNDKKFAHALGDEAKKGASREVVDDKTYGERYKNALTLCTP